MVLIPKECNTPPTSHSAFFQELSFGKGMSAENFEFSESGGSLNGRNLFTELLFCQVPYQSLHSLNALPWFSAKALLFTDFLLRRIPFPKLRSNLVFLRPTLGRPRSQLWCRRWVHLNVFGVSYLNMQASKLLFGSTCALRSGIFFRFFCFFVFLCFFFFGLVLVVEGLGWGGAWRAPPHLAWPVLGGFIIIFWWEGEGVAPWNWVYLSFGVSPVLYSFFRQWPIWCQATADNCVTEYYIKNRNFGPNVRLAETNSKFTTLSKYILKFWANTFCITAKKTPKGQIDPTSRVYTVTGGGFGLFVRHFLLFVWEGLGWDGPPKVPTSPGGGPWVHCWKV